MTAKGGLVKVDNKGERVGRCCVENCGGKPFAFLMTGDSDDLYLCRKHYKEEVAKNSHHYWEPMDKGLKI